MINRLISLIVIVLLSSCSVLKYSTKVLSHSQQQESVTGSILQEEVKKSILDTISISDKVIAIKEIKFFQDTSNKVNNKVILSDSTEILGSIKSVREVIIKNTDKNTTHQKDSLTRVVKQDSTRISNTIKDNELKVLEKPVSDPKKWRYIFYILVLLIVITIVIYLLMKKKQIMKSLLKIWKWFKY